MNRRQFIGSAAAGLTIGSGLAAGLHFADGPVPIQGDKPGPAPVKEIALFDELNQRWISFPILREGDKVFSFPGSDIPDYRHVYIYSQEVTIHSVGRASFGGKFYELHPYILSDSVFWPNYKRSWSDVLPRRLGRIALTIDGFLLSVHSDSMLE